MLIAAVQTSYDDDRPWPDLLESVVDRIEARLAGQEADLIVLPELWAVGAFRPKRWTERAEGLDGPTVMAMAGLARRTGAVVHLGAIVERDENGDLHNTAVVLDPAGEVLALYRKIHLFRAGGAEADLLTPGTDLVVVDLPLRAGGTLRAGLATCYDFRFPEMFRALVDLGAEAFVVPVSWPKVRTVAWHSFLQARAAENEALVIGVSATGTDGRTPMAGLSAIVAPTGDVIAQAGTDPEILVAEVDPAQPRELRESFPVLEDRRIPVGSGPRV